MFEQFTERARRIIIIARQEAARLQQGSISTEHLLLGIIKDNGGIGVNVIKRMGININILKLEIEKYLPIGRNTIMDADIPFSAQSKKVLEYAVEEAKLTNQNYVADEHILIGLMREQKGKAYDILSAMGLSLPHIREEINRVIAGRPDLDSMNRTIQSRKAPTPTLDEFGRDLTKLAAEGRLDPVIGRDSVIERVIQVLCRRTKNNPVLIGEPGVGKTAIAEGLAQRIASRDIPEILASKRLISLNLGMLVAGTKYRGQFEERMKNIMREITENDNVIIFIDEIHTLIGAGAAEGSIDASNMLKPSLSRGEIQCIGATTLAEYRKYFEKDAPLERRFQTVLVSEPSDDDTVEILKGLRERYEKHHHVRITDPAIVAAISLSTRYITNKFLPDKAIDVIDEACARARIYKVILPDNLKKMESRSQQLREEQKDAIGKQDFETAAKLRDEQEKLIIRLEKEKLEWKKEQEKIEPVIGEEDIASVVSLMTGIPLQKLQERETQKLLSLEDELHKRMVGQDEGVKAVAKAIRRSRVGLQSATKPIGAFLFLGPTGVGKTELAKSLAEHLFDNEDALVRFDMSEYMEKHSVSRLVGAPPGYVGYEEGGQLTEKVRRRPYSVILLDEIEKAHPEIFNILLQIFDDGRLTDSYGHVVDFRNTIIIMTSNAGARMIGADKQMGFGKDATRSHSVIDFDRMKENVMGEVRRIFSPELINRIDEIVVFHPLEESHLRQILHLLLETMNRRLKDRQLRLQLTDEACDFLLQKGYDKIYGARPLKRVMQKFVEDTLAEELLRGKFKNRKNLKITVENDQVKFK
ncbi:ATP-dependent Clp protease ATP-binding subunit [Desulfurispirillum indicum]|uniref:ATPase AAA-2 domain protein n=1 Tax=Desulfurispirillum indicum (strain ATCC BAA-1389 / DSM 22839 / S5) TaxID=653733 RepID=E6W6J9_DESIS|nr:ATP-dependent Clp protease ATP-binding subunit [Desulfurispirillum indicum]ADU64999.1 ATPase AAA-2 domain protein [Desulfurispirillum indicum S5]UCZ56902.1 ATP-dependent Clp protease ATP-binding subunit [Desulfurispirillum indicum]